MIITLLESFLIFREYEVFYDFDTKNTGPVIGYMIGFVLVNFICYTIIPFFVRRSGATLLNISNLTSIIWSMISDIFLFHYKFVSYSPFTKGSLMAPFIAMDVPRRFHSGSFRYPNI